MMKIVISFDLGFKAFVTIFTGCVIMFSVLVNFIDSYNIVLDTRAKSIDFNIKRDEIKLN